MAPLRSFAALLDQDSVVLLEYRREATGFRLIDTRTRARRFTTPDAVADAVLELLTELRARKATVSIVLQHFGSFFHTLVLPPATDDVVRSIIVREAERSFNIFDPVVSYSIGDTVERREASRAGGVVPRQVYIAGAPRSVIETLQEKLQKARVHVEGLTVIPDVFRRLYDALDGSTEATAMLVCLQNGPHVGFFVNARLELAIEPPLALEGEAPLDSAVIIDQLERGAIFLRQQARGTVATRLLLVAPAGEHDALASTIEARTGMHVVPLGKEIGSPEAVVAMGAVIASKAPDRLDLFPRAPKFDANLKRAMSGVGFLTSALLTAAAVAVFWCAMQIWALRSAREDLQRLQARVDQSVPAVAGLRQSAQGRARIADIRGALKAAQEERLAVVDLLATVSSAARPGAQFDSMSVLRVDDGLKTRLFGQAIGPSGPAALSAATGVYRHLRTRTGLREIDFQSAYVPRNPVPPPPAPSDFLQFTLSFVAPGARSQ